ncbi:MAG: GNAT family N-acetyltransferase [Pyrinomonadaceae bacterium]|nr:GNAT family N-acetyltransferase [Pyrinomonadaceae bacterium]
MRLEKGEFVIDTDKSLLQFDVIQAYMLEESYWAKGRTEQQMRNAIENSLCFGLFHGDAQVGFARVVSDFATFAYVGDVYVLSEHGGKGLGKWLMETIVAYPDLQGLRRWVLATRDAHKLYEKYGFTGLKHPERWMEKAAPGAY